MWLVFLKFKTISILLLSVVMPTLGCSLLKSRLTPSRLPTALWLLVCICVFACVRNGMFAYVLAYVCVRIFVFVCDEFYHIIKFMYSVPAFSVRKRSFLPFSSPCHNIPARRQAWCDLVGHSGARAVPPRLFLRNSIPKNGTALFSNFTAQGVRLRQTPLPFPYGPYHIQSWMGPFLWYPVESSTAHPVPF